MKKAKSLLKAIEVFNSWPATARIYCDFSTGRVWTETFVSAHEGRFQKHKSCVVEVHNKEGLSCEDIKISEEELLKKVQIAREELDYKI